MKELAYVNGVFSSADEACISINDRGLLFGDSVYEVIKAFGKKPFLLDDHLQRLEKTADALQIPIGNTVEVIRDLIAEGLQRTQFDETTIYIQLTRGTQQRDLIFNPSLKPNLIATFRPYLTDVHKMRATGVRMALKPDIRWGYCNLKTTNLLGNVLMKNEARKEGCFDAILYTEDNNISEACSSSVFSIKNSVVYTTPSSQNILPGVNRKYILETVGPQIGIDIQEKHVSKEELLDSDEVFLTSTTFLVVPVIEVGGRPIADGKPGTIIKEIIKAANQNIAKCDGFKLKTSPQ